MKKITLLFILIVFAKGLFAQAITDTVSIGAGYANQVWYSLQSDEQGNAPKNNWDLAFSASGFGFSILINSVGGTMLWGYPKSDTSGWGSVDSSGLSAWPARYNSDTSWDFGAMGRYANASNPYDLDWGLYNTTTHVITGDSLYIIKLSNGDYKKLWIEYLSGGVYHFIYADLDGNNLQNATLDKANYSGKNFGYYSLQNNAALDREPLTANWDVLFTQYTAFVPSAYTVTGVLANKGVTVAKVAGVTGKDTFSNWVSQGLMPEINTIGYDWKAFVSGSYIIQDSLLYFIQTPNTEVWKLIFTGFGGSSTGSFMFSKQKIYSPTSVSEVNNVAAVVILYPNPAKNSIVNLVYSLQANVRGARVSIYDIAGRIVMNTAVDGTQGLHNFILPTQSYSPGIYIANLQLGTSNIQKKLVIE